MGFDFSHACINVEKLGTFAPNFTNMLFKILVWYNDAHLFDLLKLSDAKYTRVYKTS